MKAFVVRSFGSPDVVELAEVETPVPGDGEVLVRVYAASVNPYDWHHMRGEPYVARLMGGIGLRTPKVGILGADMAGEVAAVGRSVRGVRPGDEVFALLKQGAFAEYVCVPESVLAPKPASLSFEQAAAVPMAAITALISLRDRGNLQPGQKVLVNGASGGVGTFAVQLARAFGAEVTGVCSTRNVDLVRSIGATEVVDYTAADFTLGGRRYDLVIDIAGSKSALACRRVLTPRGAYVVVGGQAGRWVQPAGHAFAAVAISPFVSQRMLMADVVRASDKRADLLTLTALIEQGAVAPVVDRRYAFAEVPAAIRYVEEGHAPAKVVVSMMDR
ncbi:NADPH:quinone reductase-like Zn-dependent oxidoreductase [Allocatelliglobosispora scoriae]|uniref:NADPH:quinone reductase-like Zn-dependent oxidoreductase n=1 Tax=Allocatelliglobosispora scoriae TaxID=643052 RepID=A0A841BL53_9ACTN|nr:NAD(P)-dependent alcohol dehydrogenase [Allocatelliglobosispora scoriae]MBB5867929.1 NADPH:quinone reductase-like Zn-dependent oxidoreductase [Allocatelliglobosispora scoriae]